MSQRMAFPAICHLPSASPVPEAQERQMAEKGFTFEEADALQM